MQKNKNVRVLFLSLVLLLLTACGSRPSGTRLEFSFSSDDPSGEYKEQTIYINNDSETLTLHTSLKLTSGEVLIQVVSTLDNTVVWEGAYAQSDEFPITLEEVQADTEYLIRICPSDIHKMEIVITAPENLVKDPETPAKPAK